MKYSRTAIGLLTAQYRSVLKKCLLINLGLFALGAVTTAPANAAELTSTPAPASTWAGASSSITGFMNNLATETHGAWDRNDGAITGWGMDKILGALGGTGGVLERTDNTINLITAGTGYASDGFGVGLYNAVGTQISGAISGKLTGEAAAGYTHTGHTGDVLKTEIATYLSDNGGKYATVLSTSEIISDLFNDKQVWLNKEFGYDTNTTDAPTILEAAGFTPESGKLGFSQAIIQNKNAIATKLTGISASYVNGTAPAAGAYYTAASIYPSLGKADSAVQKIKLNDSGAELAPTAAGVVNLGLGSMATANTADYVSVASLAPADPATNGLSINAKSLQVKGADVLTSHQAIATGSTAGTIDVGGTDVKVNGVVLGAKINNGSTISPDANGILALTDANTTYTEGVGITIDSSAENKISVKTKTDGGITVDTNGVSVDKSVIQAKLGSSNAGNGLTYNSEGDVFSIDLAANSGLEIVNDSTSADNTKLRVKRATTVASGNSDIVDSDLLARQNYLQNGDKAQLTLSPHGDTASLVVTDGNTSSPKNLAGITLDGANKIINLTTTTDGTTALAGIEINGGASAPVVNVKGQLNATDGIKVGNFGIANGGVATLGASTLSSLHIGSTATDPTIDGIVTTVRPTTGTAGTIAENTKLATEAAVASALAEKQDNMSAGNGISISGTNAISAVADADGTIVVGTGGIKVGTIGYDNVADAAKVHSSTSPYSGDTYKKFTTKGYVDENLAAKADLNGTNYSGSGLETAVAGTADTQIAAAAVNYAKLANGNKFTGDQEFGVNDASGFKTKAKIWGDGTAGFGMNDANNSYAFVVQKGAITANQSIAAKQGITFGSGTGNSAVYQYYINSDGEASLGATTVSSLTMGTNTAASITPATGETADLSLATAKYADQQANAAADAVVDATDPNLIKFKTSAGTTEAQTYNKASLDTQIGAKYNWSNITGATEADTTPAETVTAGTHVYSVDATDQAIANAFTTNTADAYAVSGKRSSALAAHIATYVTGNADKFATVQTTNNIITDLFNDKSLYIQGITGIPLTGSAADAYAASSQAMLHSATTLLNADEILAGEIVKKADINGTNYTSSTGLYSAVGTQIEGAIQSATGTGLTYDTTGKTFSVAKEVVDTSVTPIAAPTAGNTYYDAATVYANFALKNNPGQTIVAEEVDTKTLKVADKVGSAATDTQVLEAGVDNTTAGSEFAYVNINGKTTINGATSVTGGLTADTASVTGNLSAGSLTLPDSTTGATAGDTVQISGIKKAVEANASGVSKNYLVTSDAVNTAFDTKVGTIKKQTAPGVYSDASVQQILGLDADGKLVFTEADGVSNIASGDGSKSAPTTIVGAFENISSAMGMIHGLVTETGGVKTFSKDATTASTNVVGNEYIGNLKPGTSVSDDLVSLDNAIGGLSTLTTDEKGSIVSAVNDLNGKVVHKTGDETIADVKTFTSVVNANAGVKIGNDWQIDENPTTKAFIIRDASTAGTPMVAMITKDSMALNSSAGNYFFVNDKGLSLNDTVGGAGTVFNASATTGDVIASKGKFTVATDTADASKVKVSVAGDIEATGNVKAAGLTFEGTNIAKSISTGTGDTADSLALTTTGYVADTIKTTAQNANYTNADAGLQATTIKDAIDELSNEKFDIADIVTDWSTTTSNTKVASEKLVRDTLDNILDGDTPFTGFTMTNNAATPANVKMLAIDDGNYSDKLATTFATNATVKSAVDSIFGGNPNTWTGVNIFKEQIQAQKGIQIGADYKLEENGAKNLVIRDVATDKAKVVYEEGSLGLYATDSNSKNSSYFSVLSGSKDPKKVDGMRLSSDGKAYFKALVNQLAVIDPATNKLTFSVENATGNVNTNGNAVIAGNLTAGDATKAQLTVDNATNTISLITKDSTDAAKTAGFAVDGNSAEMQASSGTYDYTFAANVENADKESIAMSVSQEDSSGNDIILSAVQADKDSISMGLGDGTTANNMVAGVNVEKGASANTVEMGTFTHDSTANNDVLTAGVKVEGGNKVSILADNGTTTANPVIEAGYNATDGNYVTINGKETVTGDFSAAGGDFTVTKGTGGNATTASLNGDLDVDGKATFTGTGTTKVEIENGVVKASNGFAVPSSSDPTKNVFSVDANGGVTATSLTLPNANFPQYSVTVTGIDKGGAPTAFSMAALATTQSINTMEQNAIFTGNGQKSLTSPVNPAPGETPVAATTIGQAINNLASYVDDTFGSIGDYSALHAAVRVLGYTGNITHETDSIDDSTVTDPEKSPTLVSAILDIDNAIGNRALYNATTTHYANNGTVATDPIPVAQAIANMDTKVYQDIHGDSTDPTSTVNIGDEAVITKVGLQDATSHDVTTGMTVNATAGSESITFTVNDTTEPKDVMTINKDGVAIDGNETVTGKVTVAASSTATSKVEIDSADGSVTSTSTAGTVKLVDGTATASNTVTAGAVDATSGALSGNGVQMKNDGTVTAKNGAETAHYDAAGITLHNGTADTFTVDTTNGDMMAAAGNFAVTTADGKTTMTIGAPAATATTGKVTIDTTGKIESIGSAADKKVTIDDGNVVVSGNTKTATFEMPDAYQPTGATSVVYAQVTGIDKGTTAANSFSDAALATTQSIKTKAENADYTASDALKAGNYATAQTSVTTINNAIESLDLRIGDWDGLHLTPNGNLTNGHAGDSTYNEPETVVEAFNNIDSTLGRIHGLVTKNSDGTYTYNKSSGTVTQDWTNLAVGTTVEEHVLAVDTAIGNRNGYTAAYNINRGESVAESLNNIDLRLGDVKSLNNMNYYGEQNPNDVNLTGAVRALDSNLYRVEHDLKTLRHDTYAGLASAAALSALVPNPRGTGDTTLSFGTGAYQGHTAAALGGFHWITNNLLVNAGVGWDNREATTRIGVSYSF